LKRFATTAVRIIITQTRHIAGQDAETQQTIVLPSAWKTMPRNLKMIMKNTSLVFQVVRIPFSKHGIGLGSRTFPALMTIRLFDAFGRNFGAWDLASSP